MTGMCPGRSDRGTWPGDSRPCAFVLAVLQGRPVFAEMWQAAGSARLWENRIPGSSQTLPNLKMPLQKPPLLPPHFLFLLCSPVASQPACSFQAWSARACFKDWCAFHRNFLTPRRSRGSHPVWESTISFSLFVPWLFCLFLSIFSLHPSALYFNLLSLCLPILCSCPFLSLFEPAHFHSSHSIMVSWDCGTRQRCNQESCARNYIQVSVALMGEYIKYILFIIPDTVYENMEGRRASWVGGRCSSGCLVADKSEHDLPVSPRH